MEKVFSLMGESAAGEKDVKASEGGGGSQLETLGLPKSFEFMPVFIFNIYTK